MTSDKKYKLVLASKSPRRRELLGWLEVPFEIHSKDIEEISDKVNPVDVAEDIAWQKCEAVYHDLQSRDDYNQTYFPVVVGSDTIVTLGDKIYGKPKNVESAKEMLLELEGKEHIVVTAVAITFQDKETKEIKKRIFSGQTKVKFEKIDKDLLEIYLKSGDSLDKAGAYGIQGQGLAFISQVSGSYSNVVGFPLSDFVSHFKDILGYKDDTQGEWRKCFHN
jgi:septum formation protein